MTARHVELTKTSMYHTSSSPITVNLDDISRMEWDDELRSTAVYMKTGKSFMVAEHPSWIEKAGQPTDIERYQAFVAAVVEKFSVCPACSYLWHECECGVNAASLDKEMT